MVSLSVTSRIRTVRKNQASKSIPKLKPWIVLLCSHSVSFLFLANVEGQGTPEGTTTTTHISETTIRTTKVLKTVVIGGGDLTEEELAAGGS